MHPENLLPRAARLIDLYRARGWRVATAESCTGGLITAILTEIAGSSDVVDRGFVTYSNEAKTELLGVPAALIAANGAVSDAVAAAVAAGAMANARADVVVSVTGIAGPGGGTVEKPVGLVWFGCAVRSRGRETKAVIFPGDRAAIRIASVATAFDLFEAALNEAGKNDG
jgi:nicotinamide-nucleotide amidase